MSEIQKPPNVVDLWQIAQELETKARECTKLSIFEFENLFSQNSRKNSYFCRRTQLWQIFHNISFEGNFKGRASKANLFF